MATTYSNEANGPLNSTPATKAEGSVVGGRLRRYRATITLASQASGDDVVLAEIPAGSVFAYGMLNSSVSLGTATVAVGITGDTGKYRAAATFTATNTPTPFGDVTEVSGSALASGTQVLLTVGTASLPASGTLVVDLYFTNG